jgi:hypothetical protein
MRHHYRLKSHFSGLLASSSMFSHGNVKAGGVGPVPSENPLASHTVKQRKSLSASAAPKTAFGHASTVQVQSTTPAQRVAEENDSLLALQVRRENLLVLLYLEHLDDALQIAFLFHVFLLPQHHVPAQCSDLPQMTTIVD